MAGVEAKMITAGKAIEQSSSVCPRGLPQNKISAERIIEHPGPLHISCLNGSPRMRNFC